MWLNRWQARPTVQSELAPLGRAERGALVRQGFSSSATPPAPALVPSLEAT